MRPMFRLAAPLALTLALAAPARAGELDEGELPQVVGEARARIQNVEQELNDWNVDGAAQELAELVKLAPPDTRYVEYLQARVAFEQGRYDEAVRSLEKAGLSDKPGTWLRLMKDTRQIVSTHEKFESAHFVLLAPRGKDAILAPWALDALEKQRAALEQDLGYAPPGKVRVELVSSAGELARVSTLSKEAIRTTGTIAICKFDKLMVTSPKAVIHGYDWLDTLAHEYTHLVVSRKSRNTVPIWMHEGLAKYLESRWRGPAGGAMTPSTLALLGSRVRKNTLVPFEKMHPSMALLPTAEDAATAFAEVFFAIELVHREGGPRALEALLDAMARGGSDKAAIEAVVKKTWPAFEKAWMASLKRQPYPKELIPPDSQDRKELAENAPNKAKKDQDKGREIGFGDFAEVTETDARRAAHLGELLRERDRPAAAAEQYQRAHAAVGDRYESVSNKYALALFELKRYDDAEKVLLGSLAVHPGSAQTSVHLGRIALRRHQYAKVKAAYLDALAVDPFNEEIHLALYQAAGALGDRALQAQALAACVLLLKLKPDEVQALAATLGSDGPPEAPAAPDAGR